MHPPFKILLAVVTSLALAACGSSGKKQKSTTASPASQPTALSLTISDSGKKSAFTAPASTQGGLVTITLQNQGKKPHSAQLASIGAHTPVQVLKALGGKGPPPWAHLVGGTPDVAPGRTGTATVVLGAGNYAIIDFGAMGGGGGSGPPAFKALKVTGGAGGSLPSTPTTVTAAAPAKDKYKWQISGPVKAGENRLTFVSKGAKDAIHLIAAVRVNGHPSDAAIAKALKSNGKPPAFVDQKSFTATAILDGGKSEVTSLSLQKPGEYILFCPLTDRDGGKPHDQEGLLTRLNVK
jgi:hypothetical protein